MSDRLDVVSLGEPMVEFSQIPGEDRRYLQGLGGDTMNAAIAAARQGARVGYVTRLGDDAFGQTCLDLWRDEGLDTSGVSLDPDAPTAVYFITHTAAGHVFSYRRAGSAASRMTPRDLPADLIRSARFFHTSGITQAISETACDTVFAALAVAREGGARIVYDANLRLKLWPLARARAVIVATIEQADYFLPSLEDAQALSGHEAPDAIVDWALKLGAKHVALKLGPGGVLHADASGRGRITGHEIRCVDATGAGDCFAGSLMARLAAGDDFVTALTYANAAAALTCTGYGAVAPLPRPDAVRALLNRSMR
ncbi:MAG: sugar kinase [Burkholderiales bacterium]|nr:sugar kinase [Burkholderiales bacterium]